MPKALLLVVSLFFAGVLLAQNNSSLPEGFVMAQKPVLCGPVEIVFRSLASKEINEKPNWVGTLENGSNIAVFSNATTSAFTVIQFGEHMACVLGLGETGEFFRQNLRK